MKNSVFAIVCIVLVNVFIIDCSKKQVQVSLPEPEPVKETPAAPPPEPKPVVDSAAIIAAHMRDVLQNIYFDFNRYNLRNEATDQLTVIGRALIEHPGISIVIEGHCDERGSSDYNMGLGENRAVSTKQWLVAYGIAETRIQTTSYGKERPAVEGCFDEACHQKNRRCEFRMLSSGVISY